MTSFLHLPEVLTLNLLSQWLTPPDLARLDSAHTNTHRKVLLCLLRHRHLTLKGSEGLIDPLYLRWLGLRGIKVSTLAISSRLLGRDQAPCSCLGLIDLTRVERLCLFNDISPPKRGFFLIPGLGLAGLPDLVGMGGWGGMVGAWAGVGAGVSGPPWSDPYQRLFIRCTALKHIDFGAVANADFAKIGMFCPTLESIRAVDCRGLKDFFVENIAQHCRGAIRSVVLRACESITSASVYALAQECPGLRHIDVSYCNSLSEGCLLSLADKCPLLETVNFEGLQNISDEVISRIADNCPHLLSLNIDYYKGLSHDGINPLSLKKVTDSCPDIQDFLTKDFHFKVRQGRPTLRLKGTYTRVPRLVGILLFCPENLHTLDASHCLRFDDSCLALCGRFSLRGLILRGAKITDAGMAEIAQKCSQLQTLDISSDITDQGLECISRCASLRCLFLKGCERLTDTGIAHLSSLSLTALDVGFCTLLTDAALNMVVLHHPHMELLDINECPKISNFAARWAAEKLPDLRYYGLSPSTAAAAANISYYSTAAAASAAASAANSAGAAAPSTANAGAAASTTSASAGYTSTGYAHTGLYVSTAGLTAQHRNLYKRG